MSPIDDAGLIDRADSGR
jgi:hypothetical protein